MVKRGNLLSIGQLIDSLESALDRFEFAFNSGNYEEFMKIKKFMLDVQKKIIKLSK